MPKDKISHSDAVQNVDGHDCRIEVGWAKGGPYVTVSAVTDQAYRLDDPHAATAEDRDRLGLPPVSEPVDFHGFGCTLDLDGMNRLIAVLKRARRSAFGADETGPFGCSEDGVFYPVDLDEGAGQSAESDPVA